MKKSTGFWLTVSLLAAGAAIGNACARRKHVCGAHCPCHKDAHDHHHMHGDRHDSHGDLRSELLAQVERLKQKLSSLL